MRVLLMLLAASLLTVPAVAADHDGDLPHQCESAPSYPCADYCIHGTGIGYQVSYSKGEGLNVAHPNCWVM